MSSEELRQRAQTVLAATVLTVSRERKGRPVDDDIRPAIRTLSVDGSDGRLRADLATHPRGVRPNDLVTALGADVVLGRACRTHQWIERDGARFEPLQVSGLASSIAAAQNARRALPHVRAGSQPDPTGSSPEAGSSPSPPAAPRQASPRQAQDRRHAPGRRCRRPQPAARTRPATAAPAPRPRPGGRPGALGFHRDRRSPRAGEAGPADAGDGDGDGVAGPSARASRRRSGSRDRRSKQVGRYLVCVHVQPQMTQIAMLEGAPWSSTTCRGRPTTPPRSTGTSTGAGCRTCSRAWRRPSSTSGSRRTPCSTGATCATTRTTSRAGPSSQPRIEDVLKAGQTILCQVTKNPIGAKGARLTQEVSLPGRFAVLVPNSSAFGISKRLGDNERRRLRRIIDEVKPAGHGMIVRTAAEGVSADELQRDVTVPARAVEHH